MPRARAADSIPDPPEETDVVEDSELPLSEVSRYEVQLGTTFTYRGLSHWPKIVLSDSMMLFENEAGELEPEGQESLVYRVEHVAHARLGAVIARMKRDVDERYEADQAARKAAAPAATPEATQTQGETA